MSEKMENNFSPPERNENSTSNKNISSSKMSKTSKNSVEVSIFE